MNLNFRITHSSKAKKQASKSNYKKLIFCIFDKNDASKNKIKQNKNKVKDCA
jgi:hypothetical protein